MDLTLLDPRSGATVSFSVPEPSMAADDVAYMYLGYEVRLRETIGGRWIAFISHRSRAADIALRSHSRDRALEKARAAIEKMVNQPPVCRPPQLSRKPRRRAPARASLLRRSRRDGERRQRASPRALCVTVPYIGKFTAAACRA